MNTRKLIATLAIGSAGLAATPASAIDSSDLTFTGLMLPTDASTNADIVVGIDALTVFGGSRLAFNDTFVYDVSNNLFSATGLVEFGGAGTFPEVSHDGTRLPGTIKSVDFGGDPGTSFDGPFDTTAVWTQTAGQPIGTGTLTDLLELDQPDPSYALENWSQYDPNGNPPGYVPSAFDRNLGSGYGISGDGNVVTGNYYRRQVRDANTNAVIFEGGGMPLAFDLTTNTATPISGNGPALQLDGQALGADLDGDVAAGFTDNSKPTIWRGTTAYVLDGHPDGVTGRAIAVSNDGNSVAGYQRVIMPDGPTNPITGAPISTQGQVLWQYSASRDQWFRTTIGRLPNRTEGLAEATGISADGKIVVGYDDAKTLIQGGGIAGSGDNGQGTFWTKHTGMVNIEDFLEARGLDLTGIEIGSIQGISPDGNTLLAWGYLGGQTLNELSGVLIDVSSSPLDIPADQAALNTATANLGNAAAYAGDTYFGDWTRDGMVTVHDVNKLGYLINGGIGDADLDGDIDDTDLGLAISSFSGPGFAAKMLEDGDNDGDGDVDDTDLGVAISGFTGPLAPASVPEPASALLLGAAGLTLCRRRRA